MFPHASATAQLLVMSRQVYTYRVGDMDGTDGHTRMAALGTPHWLAGHSKVNQRHATSSIPNQHGLAVTPYIDGSQWVLTHDAASTPAAERAKC